MPAQFLVMLNWVCLSRQSMFHPPYKNLDRHSCGEDERAIMKQMQHNPMRYVFIVQYLFLGHILTFP